MRIGSWVFRFAALASALGIGLVGVRDPDWHKDIIIYFLAGILVLEVVVVRTMFGHVAFARGSERVGKSIDLILSLMMGLLPASLIWRTSLTLEFDKIGYSIVDIITWIGTFSTLLFVMFQTAANFAIEQSRSELNLREGVANRIIVLRNLLHKIEINWTSPPEIVSTKTEIYHLMGEIESLLLSFVLIDSIPLQIFMEARGSLKSWPDRFDNKGAMANYVDLMQGLFVRLQSSLLDRREN